MPGLDIFAFAVYTTDKGSATGKRARSPELLTRSNRWFAVPGGYFFLLLACIKRLIMPTMRIPSRIKSVYVTIVEAPLSMCRRAKEAVSLRKNAVGSRPLAVYR